MLFRRPGFLLSLASAPLLALLALGAAGCTPSIGDGCEVSTNCSSAGDRLCDLAQPGGYCTIFNCQPNACPEEAACVMFHAAVPGCQYNDRGQRSGKSFCVKRCKSDSDCRAEYHCANPLDPPLSAQILDDNQQQPVCVPNTIESAIGGASVSDPKVCQAGSVSNPSDIDASTPKPDAGADASIPDAGGDSGDASADGGR